MKLKTIAKSLNRPFCCIRLRRLRKQRFKLHKASSQSSQASDSGLKTVKIASVGSDADIWRHIAESEQAKSRPKNRSSRN